MSIAGLVQLQLQRTRPQIHQVESPLEYQLTDRGYQILAVRHGTLNTLTLSRYHHSLDWQENIFFHSDAQGFLSV
jgi:hypothetical protein